MQSVALIVDHPERDLLGLVLVAHRLCQQGIKCHLVPNRLAASELAGLAPDLVLTNHVKKADEKRVAFLSEIGSKVVVLDSEGGVIESFDAYRRALTPLEEIRGAIDCYCAWGSRMAERAEKERWFCDGRVVVTGPPRFDFYSDPWKRGVVSRSFARSLPRKPIVMFAGTFTLANPRFKSPEHEYALLIDQANVDPSAAQHRLNCEKQTFRGLIDLSEHVVRKTPGVSCVYRPHPFERIETYETALPSDVHLRGDGSIQEWLLAANALVQRGSTTAIEAAIAGIPVLTPGWLPDWAEVKAIQMVSTCCGSPDELVRELGSIIEGHQGISALSNEARSEIASWFSECDGKAHERVSDAVIETLDRRKSAVDKDKALGWFVGTLPEHLPRITRAAGHLRKMFRIPLDFSMWRIRRIRGPIPWDHEGRVFDASGVDSALEMISEVSSNLGGTGRPRVRAFPANSVGSYLRPYSAGRSVTVSQVSPGG